MPRDDNLWCCIQQMNLDAFWEREPGTVYGNYLNLRENLRIWQELGIWIERVMPWMGPFPLRDVLGYAGAVSMLVKSMWAGRYADYTQFETIQNLRLAMSNLESASTAGATSAMVVGKDFHTAVIMQSPTRTEWFKKFALSCLKRMGQVVRSDLAVTIEVMLELMARLEMMAR